jgi:hypothetical protein
MPDIVYFKGEDFDEDEGDEVGSVAVVDEDTGSVRRDHGWQSRTYAKKLGADLGLRVELDGMSDGEIEAFKQAQGYS